MNKKIEIRRLSFKLLQNILLMSENNTFNMDITKYQSSYESKIINEWKKTDYEKN